MYQLQRFDSNVEKQLEALNSRKNFGFRFQNKDYAFKIDVKKSQVFISSQNHACDFSSLNGNLNAFPNQSLDPFDLEEPTALMEFCIQVAKTLDLNFLICKEAIQTIHPDPNFLLRFAYFMMFG